MRGLNRHKPTGLWRCCSKRDVVVRSQSTGLAGSVMVGLCKRIKCAARFIVTTHVTICSKIYVLPLNKRVPFFLQVLSPPSLER
ncbi:hypothetical protein TSMEX_002722 [Taenia solium]|eukprot:TsM_000847800 transcript=TsM_000847800 gene=TsM_000847800